MPLEFVPVCLVAGAICNIGFAIRKTGYTMLEYLALGMLCLSVTAIFYIFIFIHDLPHRLAKQRNHPQQEAIHYACWLSLFTLHAIWPLVFLWSVSNRDPVRVSVEGDGPDASDRIAVLEKRIVDLESKSGSRSAGGEG